MPDRSEAGTALLQCATARRSAIDIADQYITADTPEVVICRVPIVRKQIFLTLIPRLLFLTHVTQSKFNRGKRELRLPSEHQSFGRCHFVRIRARLGLPLRLTFHVIAGRTALRLRPE